jgi:hypothetical protein
MRLGSLSSSVDAPSTPNSADLVGEVHLPWAAYPPYMTSRHATLGVFDLYEEDVSNRCDVVIKMFSTEREVYDW